MKLVNLQAYGSASVPQNLLITGLCSVTQPVLFKRSMGFVILQNQKTSLDLFYLRNVIFEMPVRELHV